MKLSIRILMSGLLAMPALGLTGDHLDSKPAPAKPTFDLKTAGVKDVIRTHALAEAASEKTDPAESAATDLKPLPFRAPRRVHHMECDSFNCVAYTADNDALFSVPRDQYFGVRENDGSRDSWLSCQSGNNLLSTFERYDKCRGVSVGIPVQMHDVIVNVPVISR